MKKIFALLLLFSVATLTFASPKNQDSSFGKVELKKEVSMPSFDFDFAEMKLSLLDVYASDKVENDFITGKTCDGFTVNPFKPPVNLQTGILITTNKNIAAFEQFQQTNYLQGNFLSVGSNK